MDKKLIASIIALCATTSILAQKTFNVTVTNSHAKAKANAPVVMSLDDFGMDVKSALVITDGREIPCQLDDINQDGHMDELCFITDVNGKSSRKFSVTLYNTGSPREYEPQVYVEMLLKNKKIKSENKQNLYISELTVDIGTNPYWQLHHHGAEF